MATQAELEAELVVLKAAISTILTGSQSVTTDGRTLTRADLKTLYDEKRELEQRISSSTNNSSKIRLVNFS